MAKYLCNSKHAESLTGGRMIAPSEIVELSKQEANDSYNAKLIARGILVKMKTKKPLKDEGVVE